MADTSRLKDALNQLASKVDDFVSRSQTTNPGQVSDVQPEIDELTDYVRSIYARIP